MDKLEAEKKKNLLVKDDGDRRESALSNIKYVFLGPIFDLFINIAKYPKLHKKAEDLSHGHQPKK